MYDLHPGPGALRRPRLLVRAARCGLDDYRRDRDLRRLLGTVPPPARALSALMAEEAQLDESRRAGAAGYNLSRHLEVMIAMMAEAQALGCPD